MPERCPVLMYHAVCQADQMGPADPHYAVTKAGFARQLDLLAGRSLRASAVRDLLNGSSVNQIGMTFDDGHQSNFDAACMLAERGMSADFFINSSTVGTAHFLSWAQLRDMHAMGMSIQSHGVTHRYFEDLPGNELLAELRDSRATIQQKLGQPCDLLAPPGGRMNSEVPRIARELGYRALCSSLADSWRHGTSIWSIPRIAVLHQTSDAQFVRWLTNDRVELARMRTKYQVLRFAKKVVGNGRYERLRAKALGSQTQ